MNPVIEPKHTVTTGTHFIEANTENMSLDDIRDNHIIPVFIKDNEPLISQTQFVEAVQDCTHSIFDNETISAPDIRVSHPVKGRVPNARHKAAKELLDAEKTIYYERMIFKLDIPSVCRTIEGEEISLSVGGVKAYNQDSIGKDSRSPQHFKLFVGFKNTVCSNLCLWSDGSVQEVRASSLNDLYNHIERLIRDFEFESALAKMSRWENLVLTERQFAQLLGRCRMYSSLQSNLKKEIFPLEITDSQMMAASRSYGKMNIGKSDAYLSLWQLYNLFTSAIKSSYIDKYLDRNINCHELVSHLHQSLEKGKDSWYLS